MLHPRNLAGVDMVQRGHEPDRPWRRYRVAGLAVGLVLVLAGAVLAVLRPGSHAAAPAASAAPTTTSQPPSATSPPRTTAPPATRRPRLRAPLGRVVARIPMPDGLTPMVPAVGGGSVWVVAMNADVSAMVDPRSYLARVDLATKRITARIPVPGLGLGAGAVTAFGAGSVWVVDSDATSHDVVSKVDPGRNRVVDRIKVGTEPADVTVAGGAVWVLNSVDETVSRIDPDSDEVVATVHLPDVAAPPESITSSGGALWLPATDLGLVRIDPATNQSSIIPLRGCCSGPIMADGGAIWAADSSTATLLRFQPVSRRIARIPLSDVVDLVTDGDQVVALGHAQVTWIDPSTNRLAGVLPISGSYGIAGGAGTVWVAELESKSLMRLAAP